MRTVVNIIFILSFALLVLAAVPKKCRAPVVYPNTTLYKATTSKSSFNNGIKVFYRCAEGYISNGGSSKVICQSGKWSNLTLKCTKKTCGNAGDLYNGNLIYEGGAYIGEKVFAKCKEGYVLKGPSFLVCENTGWSGQLPTCEEETSPPVIETTTCPAPFVNNSMQEIAQVEVYQVGDCVNIACQAGFQLDGAQLITCGSDGQWQPLPPRCTLIPNKSFGKRESECDVPEIIENSHASLHPKHADVTTFYNGDKIYYVCETGYRASAGSRIRKCNNGKWTKMTLKCERKLCGQAGEILNGQFIYSGVEFGDTATAKCNEGYQMIGQATRNCLGDGWDGRAPVCEAVVCPEPEVSSAKRKGVQQEPYAYLTAILYECTFGTLVGSSEIWCTENGTWSSSPPECRELGCPSPKVSNAFWMRKHQERHEPMEMLTIECRSGYALKGSASIYCSKEGRWQPEPPTCVPATSRRYKRKRG